MLVQTRQLNKKNREKFPGFGDRILITEYENASYGLGYP
jgi:hypothetical protein